LSQLAYPISQEGPIVVVGFGRVGQKVGEFLTDTGEEVHAIDKTEGPGVDVVGDVTDSRVLARASVLNARAIILALDSDSATVFAATVIRDYAPDLPIIARVNRCENVERIQRAGVDYALAVSQVAGQLLTHHVLGETVSLQPRIKLVKLRPGSLIGHNPLAAKVRERTGCTIVAVERDGEVVMDISPSFMLQQDDALYVCGTTNAVNRYYDEFPLSHQ
jgi:Trk K+ transport system NAD-binding subunit